MRYESVKPCVNRANRSMWDGAAASCSKSQVGADGGGRSVHVPHDITGRKRKLGALV